MTVRGEDVNRVGQQDRLTETTDDRQQKQARVRHGHVAYRARIGQSNSRGSDI